MPLSAFFVPILKPGRGEHCGYAVVLDGFRHLGGNKAVGCIGERCLTEQERNF